MPTDYKQDKPSHATPEPIHKRTVGDRFKTFRSASAIVILSGLAVAAQKSNAAAYVFGTAPVSIQGQYTLGFTFTAVTDVVVTSLGYFDDLGDGFQTQHVVGIFSGDGANGPGTLLTSTTLASGKSGVLGANNFRYQNIPSFTLVSGQVYTIAGLSPNYSTVNDAFVYGGPLEITGFAVSPFISIAANAARFSFNTPTLMDPALHFNGDFQIYAVNFGGPVLSAALVPEPATWLMMVGGFGFVASALRTRKRGTAMSVSA